MISMIEAALNDHRNDAVPGASTARVAREHGVNANQVFRWRYKYRKGILPPRAKEPFILDTLKRCKRKQAHQPMRASGLLVILRCLR